MSGRGGDVSIPQSGFGAFEHAGTGQRNHSGAREFQSLSRDSGRLNAQPHPDLNRLSGSFNPSVGIRGV